MNRPSALLLVLATVLAACSSDPAGPQPGSVLDGLQQSVVRDSTGSTPPGDPVTPGPGAVHGTVLLPSNGGGADSLQTAPRVAGATVTAYPVSSSTSVELGPEAASVVSGADGTFALPTLPGGDYIVVIDPPTGLAATNYGQWVRTTIHPGSGDFPWWVVLATK